MIGIYTNRQLIYVRAYNSFRESQWKLTIFICYNKRSNNPMKFKKSLIAAVVTGAGVITAAPAISAADYSTSVSGNIRVQATAKTEGDADEVLATSFGGEDDESTTGGDTYLQWNHNFANDDGSTTGGGFLRFTGDGNVRINVNAASTLGNYKGELKAEWEQDGLTGDVTADRDQFAKLTHTPSGVYYKIGREQWLDGHKGYTSDFLSQTKGTGWVSGENRFSAHALGWGGYGASIALLIQRNNNAQAFARPGGRGIDQYSGSATDDARQRQTVSGFGLKVGYAQGPVDIELNLGSATATGDALAADSESGAAAVDETDRTVSYTQLHSAFPVGVVTPFLNFGSGSDKDDGAGTESTYSGWNLGVSVPLGASDLVVAYGSRTEDDNDAKSGFDLIWATNKEPLKVSLGYSSFGDSSTTSQYGVRLDFGF